MPVNTPSSDYNEKAPAWQLMRDACAGQRAIHKAGEKYLPRLRGESNVDYAARLARSGWFNATWRTVEALVGMLFRKPPVVEISGAAEKHLEDVTKDGRPFALFAKDVGQDFEIVGRVGVLVDFPTVQREPGAPALTIKQVEQQNIRPHMGMYLAEDIIDVRHDWIGGRTRLSHVRLRERASVPGLDEFERKVEERVRVLDLDEAGHYRVRVFKVSDGQDELLSEAWPLMDNQRMTDIPFEVFGDGVPPLEDLANVNVSLYRTNSDLEHGAHWTALPQPWVAGLDADPIDGSGAPARGKQPELTIGSGAAWNLGPTGSAGMLEFTGAGLAALRDICKDKKQEMAVLGARMLEEQKSGVESAETAGIHRSGEQSSLQAQADVLGLGFARLLAVFDKWSGGSGEGVTCAINKDFMPMRLSAQDITALVGAWQSGGMSFETLFENFQKGGVVGDGVDVETEQARIQTAAPSLSPTPPATSGDPEPGTGGE